MHLSFWRQSNKCKHLAKYLVILTILGVLCLSLPLLAGATDQSNDNYEAAENLEIWVGYWGENPRVYEELKIFKPAEIKAISEQHIYSFIDNMPCPVVDPAVGVTLETLLKACKIDPSNVRNFRFWTNDVPRNPYQTLSADFLLYTDGYYFPHLGENWTTVENEFIDPTTRYSGDMDIYFPDVQAAMADAVRVPAMLAYEDNWQRLDGSGARLGFSNLIPDTRYRLLFGHPGDLDSSNPTHTASKACKWTYRVDITLEGTREDYDLTEDEDNDDSGVSGGASSSSDITKIELNKSEVTLFVGGLEQLTSTISPDTAVNKNVSWLSSNPAIATVSPIGLVTAVSSGTTTITVTTESGKKTAVCAVTVVQAPPPDKVSLDKSELTLITGSSDQLTAVVTPEDANPAIIWVTSNPQVATIDANGVVTAISAGISIITAKSADESQSDTCVVTVITETAASFADIQGHWAEKNIKDLIASGVINGYPDNTFRPNQTISRAEFVAILVKTFNIPTQTGKTFNDTREHWAKEAISSAVAGSVASGLSETTFGPNEPITREQMAVMVVKAAQLTNEANEQLINFADQKEISSWALESVNMIITNGIMSGYPDNIFAPQKKATRAEAVTVIINALNLGGK